MVFIYQNHRDFLQGLVSGKARNRPKMSLRAFAERLGMSNSFLSEVISGKKTLSMEAAFKIAVKLELTDAETQYFCLLVQIDQEQDQDYKEILIRRLKALNPDHKAHDLSLDLFKTMSDWYHFAILELTYVTGLTVNVKTVVERLGISPSEAETALERLRRLELLEVDKTTKKLRKAHDYVITESHVPSSALRILHRQLLERAIDSLESQTPQERVSASDVLAIDTKYVAEMDRLSREFSKAILQLSEKSKVKDAVYACVFHGFRLTDTQTIKRKN